MDSFVWIDPFEEIEKARNDANRARDYAREDILTYVGSDVDNVFKQELHALARQKAEESFRRYVEPEMVRSTGRALEEAYARHLVGVMSYSASAQFLSTAEVSFRARPDAPLPIDRIEAVVSQKMPTQADRALELARLMSVVPGVWGEKTND